MLRYLYADLIRVMKKISFWLVALMPAGGAMLLLYLSRDRIADSTYAIYVTISFSMQAFAIIVGGAIMVSVFHNDVKAKAMQNVIGSGVSRTKAFIAKMLEVAILSAIIAIITAVATILAAIILGLDINNSQCLNILIAFLTAGLYTVAIVGVVSPILFLFQSPIGGLTLYLIIASQAFYGLMMLALTTEQVVNLFGDLTPYLASNAFSKITEALTYTNGSVLHASEFIIISMYALIPSVITAILFQRKDLEI